jgi:hypothetical protein
MENDNILNHIRDNTRIHATNQVWAQVRVLVGDRVNSLVMIQVNTQVLDVRNHVYGQFWNDIRGH